MSIFKKWTLALLMMVFTLSGSWAYGETPPAEEPGKTGWEFIVAPYFWMASLSGDVTVHGIPAHVDLPFSDTLQALDFGGQVHLEAWKRQVGSLSRYHVYGSFSGCTGCSSPTRSGQR